MDEKRDGQGQLFGGDAGRPASATPEKPKRLSRIITIADIAKERGVGRTTAREWLLALDAKSGGKVVLRVGVGPRAKIYTTVARLHAADCGWVEAKEIEGDRIEEFEKKLADLAKEFRLHKIRTRDVLRAMKSPPPDDGSDRD